MSNEENPDGRKTNPKIPSPTKEKRIVSLDLEVLIESLFRFFSSS